MAFRRSCSCQENCGIYYMCAVLGTNFAQQDTLWERLTIIVSVFPKVVENAYCRKIWPSVCMKYSMGFIVALDVDSWMVESHLLMPANCQKGISPCIFLRNVILGMISTTD